MSAILDNITGGGLLPHVYCRKITLENSSIEGKTDVTLLLELYQDKNRLTDSTWLNSLSSEGGGNFLDAMFIQVLPFRNKDNVKKLRPSNEPLEKGGNVYTGKHYFGDAYLPRGHAGELLTDRKWPLPPDSGVFAPLGTENITTIPAPLQVSNSSLLGNIAGSDILLEYQAQGKVREEVVNGRPYYIIPFEYKETFDLADINNSLGYAFYTFLDVPYWAENLSGLDLSIGPDYFEEFIVEGPINTEVVFINGVLQQTREAFFLSNGQVWEGSAHLHASGPDGNPAPDGYSGDGGLSNLSPSAPYRGWMVGESHNLAEGQPKLRLAQVPNNKILDFRATGITKGPMQQDALGLNMKQEQQFVETTAFDQMIERVGAVFQKEKKKDFIGDNDSEYSKLYVSRDRAGNARGLFFINLHELLKNNSVLYSSMPGASAHLLSILDKSAFLELKLYRDRVKEHIIGPRRENYSNDQDYEEPSKLVGTIAGYQSGNQAQINDDSVISGATINAVEMSSFESRKIRYFRFADYDVAKQAAGLYQYRLEIQFKDGTYEFLYELYKELANTKVLLQHYYDLAVSSYTDSATAGFTYTASGQKEEYSKTVFKKYYKNGAYVGQFNLQAQQLFSESKPWNTAPSLLMKAYTIFLGHQDLAGDLSDSFTLANNLDPVTGSPKGIEHLSKIANIYIRKLEVILGINKIKKASSGLTANSNTSDFNSMSLLSRIISQANYTISKDHAFEGPQELFAAISNKNIYIDYLSTVTDHVNIPANQALRVVAHPDYKDRCKLETAKFAQLPTGRWDTYNISPWSSYADGPIEKNGEDYFSNTGFSYLAPAIIELSDSPNSENDKSYNFKYSVFSNNPFPYLDNPESTPASSMLAATYDASQFGPDTLLINMLNYTLNKEDVKDTDLLDSSFSYEKFGEPEDFWKQKESYKRTFEELGMTFHDIGQHNSFFQNAEGHDREPGAVSIDVPEATITLANGEKSMYTLDNFSDKGIFPKDFFGDFLRSDKQGFVRLENNSLDYGYLKDLPNIFKFHAVKGNQESIPGMVSTPLSQPVWDPVLAAPNAAKYDSFIYFNLNLTVKIEVFKGTSGNAKNDEDSWRLLKGTDLIDSNGVMFCRMSYYDEKLVRGIKLPILDKYFLISPSYLGSGRAAVDFTNEETQFTALAQNTFWAEQNEQTMKDYADSTGQGFDFGGGFQGTGAPTDMGPTYSTIDPGELLTGPDSAGVTQRSSTPSGDDDYEAPLFDPKLVDY